MSFNIISRSSESLRTFVKYPELIKLFNCTEKGILRLNKICFNSVESSCVLFNWYNLSKIMISANVSWRFCLIIFDKFSFFVINEIHIQHLNIKIVILLCMMQWSYIYLSVTGRTISWGTVMKSLEMSNVILMWFEIVLFPKLFWRASSR